MSIFRHKAPARDITPFSGLKIGTSSLFAQTVKGDLFLCAVCSNENESFGKFGEWVMEHALKKDDLVFSYMMNTNHHIEGRYLVPDERKLFTIEIKEKDSESSAGIIITPVKSSIEEYMKSVADVIAERSIFRASKLKSLSAECSRSGGERLIKTVDGCEYTVFQSSAIEDALSDFA